MLQGRLSRDQVIALLISPIILVILAALYVVVVTMQGRPFLHRSERMKGADSAFDLLKIRTMHPADQQEDGPLGGHNTCRVTPLGRILRRTRLDELPQILNVIRGDIGFVGPRPPLRRHVAARPKCYARLLEDCRPGITGLATVVVHRREERLLSQCRSGSETEEVYLRRCLPVKLRLDMMYASKRSIALDLLILWRTFSGLRVRGHVRALPRTHAAKDAQGAKVAGVLLRSA